MALALRQRVGVVLGPLAFVACGLVLGAAGLPVAARWAAATVVLMTVWWITEPVPLWATAFWPLVVFPLVGAGSLDQVVLQYFDPVNFLFLGGMWIAAAMEQQGLHRRMALGIVIRIGTSPRQIVLGFMLATGFVSLWISNTAAALMMFPIGMAVLRRFEQERGGNDPLLRRFGLALMLGIGYAASMAGIGSKLGTGTNLVFVKHSAQVLSQEVSFFAWFKVGLPVVLVSIPLAWIYLVRIVARLPPTEFLGGKETIEQTRRQLGPWRRGEQVALAGFLAAAFLWTFRQRMDLGLFVIPGWAEAIPWSWSDILGRAVSTLPSPWSELLGARGAESMVALVIALVLMLIPVQRRPVRAALSLRQASGISWGILALVGGGFAMAYGIEQSGLSATIARALKTLVPASPYLALLATCFVTIILSEVASNTATASILLPLLAASASSFGLHPGTLMFSATLAASFGFMLPAGTPPNAVVFSSGYISVTQMARSGVVVDIGGAIVIATLGYFLVPWALGVPR